MEMFITGWPQTSCLYLSEKSRSLLLNLKKNLLTLTYCYLSCLIKTECWLKHFERLGEMDKR